MEKLNIIIVSFIMIVLGIVLLDVLADTNSISTSTRTVTNASYTFTNDSTKCTRISSGNCLASITSIQNITSSITLPANNYSICYNGGTPDGVKILGGQNLTWDGINGQSVYITYEQSVGCQYVNNTVSRNLLPLLIILFTIGVLAIGIWIAYKFDWFDVG